MKLNEKGIHIIELMIVISIIGILAGIAVPNILDYLDDEKIAQKTGQLVKEFKDEVETEIKTITKTKVIDKSGVQCIDGLKVIMIDGEAYYLGTIKNSWGDLAPVECQ